MIYYLYFFIFILESIILKTAQQQLEKKYQMMGRCVSFQDIFDKVFLFLSFWQLTLLYSLRAPVISDTQHDLNRYIVFFETAADGFDYNTYLEPGFRFYMTICSFISTDIPFILFSFSFIVIALTLWFINRYSKNVYLSVYIYYGMIYYFNLFNLIRQCIAMSIGLIAYYLIDQEKNWQALLVIIIAMQFHSSAIILVALFLVKKIHVSINVQYFIVVTCIACAMLGLGSIFLGPFISALGTKYMGYIVDSEAGNIANPIIYLLILLIICILHNKENSKSGEFFINAFSVGICMYFISIQIFMFNRMAYYFTTLVICLVPNIIAKIQNHHIRECSVVGAYLAVTIYGIILIIRNAHGILPYELGL